MPAFSAPGRHPSRIHSGVVLPAFYVPVSVRFFPIIALAAERNVVTAAFRADGSRILLVLYGNQLFARAFPRLVEIIQKGYADGDSETDRYRYVMVW